ncbi:hypothetical protein PHMEG_00020565 [Phytophthora megakarya]|uniref:Uncharacterized protein n=1 Tax=Phytophthora megakarya TaxID=4795 RepID=A0A225VPX7_9STRA|nr:hypothetical protein PHMEG_00020565 [Phytophthora megakarya]
MDIQLISTTPEVAIVKEEVIKEEVCSPKTRNAREIEYHSGHRFYSAMKGMDSIPPTFRGSHTALCNEDAHAQAGFKYCLPMSGRTDTPFCTAADRADLLYAPSPKSICYASVLHMLLVSVYEELQATGNIPLIVFGSLLGAVRNGSMIPYTEDTDIGFVDNLNSKEALQQELWNKGYHMFFKGVWRVCVAPTHPLADRLYDPTQPLARYIGVPYVDLYRMHNLNNDSWDIEELKETPLLNEGQNCTVNAVNAKTTTYYSGHRFYSALMEMDPPALTFQGEHTALCEDNKRFFMKYSYCLPMSARKDTPFCIAGDRMDLLSVQSPKSVCYASVLHMLLVDVYEELKATGNTPLITFGSLLGAVRNGSMIPFTEDTDIGFVERLKHKDVVVEALRQKGYHMFFFKIWRVCVAPTHPLAARIYDPSHPLTRSFAVPYVDLYEMKKVNDSLWDVQEFVGSNGRFLPGDKVEPFSQVTINGMPFDTVRDPNYFLTQSYGPSYMTPIPRRSALVTSKKPEVVRNITKTT